MSMSCPQRPPQPVPFPICVQSPSTPALHAPRSRRKTSPASGDACVSMWPLEDLCKRSVATALFCHTAWHSAKPGQSFAEEFCESPLSSLVTKKGQNRGAVTIDDVEDLYHLISIRKEGHRVNVCKILNSLVDSVRQRLTAYLNAERVYVPWVRWCPEPTCLIQAHWPRRGVPSFPPSLIIQRGLTITNKSLCPCC